MDRWKDGWKNERTDGRTLFYRTLPAEAGVQKQGEYFKIAKEELDEPICFIILNFAKNYSFVVQDAVKSFH